MQAETSAIKAWEQQVTCGHCQQPHILTAYNVSFQDLRAGTGYAPNWQYTYICDSCNWMNIAKHLPSEVAMFIQFRE